MFMVITNHWAVCFMAAGKCIVHFKKICVCVRNTSEHLRKHTLCNDVWHDRNGKGQSCNDISFDHSFSCKRSGGIVKTCTRKSCTYHVVKQKNMTLGTWSDGTLYWWLRAFCHTKQPKVSESSALLCWGEDWLTPNSVRPFGFETNLTCKHAHVLQQPEHSHITS